MNIFGSKKGAIGKEALSEKYNEIVLAKGEAKTYFKDISSLEVWMLVKNVVSHFSQKFIKNHIYQPYEDILFDQYKNLVNEQVYNQISAIKSWYEFAMSCGYWLWMAEALLKQQSLMKMSGNKISLTGLPLDGAETEEGKHIYGLFLEEGEGFQNKWRNAVNNPLSYPTLKNLSPSVISMFGEISTYALGEVSAIIPNTNLLKEVESNLKFLVAGGYTAGIIESSYRHQ